MYVCVFCVCTCLCELKRVVQSFTTLSCHVIEGKIYKLVFYKVTQHDIRVVLNSIGMEFALSSRRNLKCSTPPSTWQRTHK